MVDFPIHKKGDKQTVKNNRPVLLLPVCWKIFECLLYGTLFDFFLRIICSLQVNRDSDQEIQLLSIKNEILSAFDMLDIP